MESKNSTLKNEQGVALLIVISSIALLTWLLADFTFETNVNKLKSYNSQDRLQSRLNAEAGLNFALAKLRIYRAGRNLLEKNSSLKAAVQPSDLEGAIIQPFIYPIPVPGNANAIQKSAAKEFQENTVIRGEISVSITSVKGFLNPNNLRIPTKDPNDNNQEDDNRGNQQNRSNNDDANQKTPQQYIEDKILETLTTSVRLKREQNDEFDELYGNLDLKLLIKELKYFVNPPNSLEDDEIPEVESLYQRLNVRPKHAPFTSIDELYLLQGWPDDIIDLIKERLTVHEVSVISLNEINKDQLEIIFPNLAEAQIEEFFKYRDGDVDLQEDPHPFKSEAQFKEFVTGRLGISEDIYDERSKEFERAGLRFGIAGNLYKVVSIGKFERASYSITAFVDLPIKPTPPPVTPPEGGNNTQNPDNQTTPQGNNNNNNNNQEQTPPPVEFMEPRIIEISLR